MLTELNYWKITRFRDAAWDRDTADTKTRLTFDTTGRKSFTVRTQHVRRRRGLSLVPL